MFIFAVPLLDPWPLEIIRRDEEIDADLWEDANAPDPDEEEMDVLPPTPPPSPPGVAAFVEVVDEGEEMDVIPPPSYPTPPSSPGFNEIEVT